jgi:hypothetical protein
VLGSVHVFLNDILTYYIVDEEYECHPNLVLEAL